MTKPSIDLAYPTEAQGDLPAFQSVEEEAAFWDTHDVTDLSELPGTGEQSSYSEIADRFVIDPDSSDDEESTYSARPRTI